jgi:hypothetical protein
MARVRRARQYCPNLTLARSLKYLETEVAARRGIKLEEVESKLSKMKMHLKNIMESQLLTVRKVETAKTVLLPTLDFMLFNGDVGEMQLRKIDQHIRGLLVECHHAL